MQKRCAPAASAARACSRIWSGPIIACIGVSASAKRDCEQNPQSSAQPPDLALTSEHMSVESPKRSSRTRHARSTSASISARSSISPSRSASSLEMRDGTATRGYDRVRTYSAGLREVPAAEEAVVAGVEVLRLPHRGVVDEVVQRAVLERERLAKRVMRERAHELAE